MARKSRANYSISQNTDAEIKKYSVGLYLRLSDEDRTDIDQNSIGNQKKVCLDFLQGKSDMQVIDTFIDNGFTGANFNRSGFQQLINAVHSKSINCIVVKDFSRFGRSYIETGEYLDKILPQIGVRFISVNDNYDSFNGESIMSLSDSFTNIINDYYVKDYSQKIRSSITAKMNQGMFLPSITSMPYGYLKDVKNSTYLVDEEVREVISNIFTMRSNGEKFNSIATILNSMGIPSPGKLRFMRGITKDSRSENALWIRSTIRKMLSDPVYLGHRVHGKVKRDTIGQKKTRRNKDEWQIIENAHPSIIIQEIFDIVQEVNQAELDKLSNYEKKDEVDFDYRPLLQDKLYCGDCGAKMTGQKNIQRARSKSPNFIFYVCSEYGRSNYKQCTRHNIRASFVAESISNALKSQTKLINKVNKKINEFEKKKSMTNSISRELAEITILKEKNASFRIRLYQDFQNHIIDKDEYIYAKEKHTQKFEELILKEDELKNKQEEAASTIETAVTMVDSIMMLKKEKTLTRGTVENLVERINIFDDNRIEIILSFKNIFQEIDKLVL